MLVCAMFIMFLFVGIEITYIGTCLMVSLLIMLFIILLLHVTEDKRNLVHTVIFRQTLIAITTFVSYVIITIMVGARANYNYKLHSASIMQHILLTEKHVISLQRKLAKLKEKASDFENELVVREKMDLEYDIDQYQQVFDALNTVKASIQLSTDLQPIRILQLEATFTLAYTVLTTLISFYIFIFANVGYIKH